MAIIFSNINTHIDAINDPAASWRSINIFTPHWRPVSRGFDPWIPAYAGMTIFTASCGKSHPQRFNKAFWLVYGFILQGIRLGKCNPNTTVVWVIRAWTKGKTIITFVREPNTDFNCYGKIGVSIIFNESTDSEYRSKNKVHYKSHSEQVFNGVLHNVGLFALNTIAQTGYAVVPRWRMVAGCPARAGQQPVAIAELTTAGNPQRSLTGSSGGIIDSLSVSTFKICFYILTLVRDADNFYSR